MVYSPSKFCRQSLSQTLVLIALSLSTIVEVDAAPSTVHPLTMQESLVDLNEAVQQYQMGDRPTALQLLLAITEDPNYPQSIQLEARIYIAEILLMEGNTQDAQRYFQEVLTINPNYNIDRFRHPPEVCTEFDFVLAQWRQRTSVAPTKPAKQNETWKRFAPFGIYQFQQGSALKGIVFSTLQVGTAITSVALFNHLVQNPGYNYTDLDEKARLEKVLTIQRASAVAFYSAWIVSSLDAQRSWQLETEQ